jgi:hypothetical protein
MEIVGGRNYVQILGDRTHELPPLLVHSALEPRRLDRAIGMAGDAIESERFLASAPAEVGGEEWAAIEQELERRRMDLALNLVEEYLGLLVHWNWGDSVLEWIRQCEIAFDSRMELRNLLHPDVWPHAGRRIQILGQFEPRAGGLPAPGTIPLRDCGHGRRLVGFLRFRCGRGRRNPPRSQRCASRRKSTAAASAIRAIPATQTPGQFHRLQAQLPISEPIEAPPK